MKRTIVAGVAVLTAGFTGLLAQQPATAPAAAPGAAAKPQPKVKSAAEAKAVQAIQAAAADPDALIKAAEDLISKFADTDYKEFALTMEAKAYQQKNDSVDARVFAERVLDINPHAYLAELVDGESIAPGIKPGDLNIDEEVAQTAKLFNGAIADVSATPKPSPQITDQAWAENVKYMIAEAHNGLGVLAQAQNNWPDAVKEYQLALDGDPEQDAYATRLANALLAAGKKADAIAVCDKLLAKPNLHPTIKKMVTQIKTEASK